MKYFALSLAALATAASVMAADSPAPTPALQKRQAFPEGLDISSIAANPSAFLSEASQLLTNPAVASYYASLTADPSFVSSVSDALVSQFGSSTANAYISSAFQEFSSVTSSAASAQSTNPKSSSSSSASSSSSSNSSSSSDAKAMSTSTWSAAIFSGAAAAGVAMLFAAI